MAVDRKLLVEDMQGVETVLLHLEGVTTKPELTERKMRIIEFRVLWHILEYLIRRDKA